jgi:predicted TIM-barrel fold metal-dependent hydrolase
MGYERPVEVVANLPSITDDERAAILAGNAEKLLGIGPKQ